MFYIVNAVVDYEGTRQSYIYISRDEAEAKYEELVAESMQNLRDWDVVVLLQADFGEDIASNDVAYNNAVKSFDVKKEKLKLKAASKKNKSV
jgi:predicted transcriptional regulator